MQFIGTIMHFKHPYNMPNNVVLINCLQLAYTNMIYLTDVISLTAFNYAIVQLKTYNTPYKTYAAYRITTLSIFLTPLDPPATRLFTEFIEFTDEKLKPKSTNRGRFY